MLHNFKLTDTVQVVLLLFWLTVYTDASVRNGKSKVSTQNEILKDGVSNEIENGEVKAKLEDEQLYYLPMQTVFGITEVRTETGGLSTTSPPHLNIDPAPIQTTYQQSTSIYRKESFVERDCKSYQSECVSETPMNELQSRFMIPSNYLTKESVIMSGHLEIASSTSSVEEVSEINNFVSQPSIALQGTILYSHNVSDL